MSGHAHRTVIDECRDRRMPELKQIVASEQPPTLLAGIRQRPKLDPHALTDGEVVRERAARGIVCDEPIGDQLHAILHDAARLKPRALT